MEDETPDVPGAWRLTLHQNPNGYRFALDAFLLADFVSPQATGPIIDLGTGCGVVACLLARRFPADPPDKGGGGVVPFVVGLELQAGLAAMAQQNVAHNALLQQVSIVQADMRGAAACLAPASFATVVSNPPYRAVGRGRLNPDSEKAIARHEVAVTLCEVVQARPAPAGAARPAAAGLPPVPPCRVVQPPRSGRSEPLPLAFRPSKP